MRTVVNPEMKKEMKQNQDLFSTSLNIQPQDTAIFINGMFFDLDVVDMISLLEIIRQEQRLMQGLHTIGILVCNLYISVFLTSVGTAIL